MATSEVAQRKRPVQSYEKDLNNSVYSDNFDQISAETVG